MNTVGAQPREAWYRLRGAEKVGQGYALWLTMVLHTQGPGFNPQDHEKGEPPKNLVLLWLLA